MEKRNDEKGKEHEKIRCKNYTDSEIVERTERYMESMSDAVSNLRGLIKIVTHIVEHDIDDRWIGVLYFLEKLEEDFRDIYGGIGYGLHYRQEQNTEETKPYVDIGKIAPFIKEAKKEINRSVADKLAEATVLLIITHPSLRWNRSGYEQCMGRIVHLMYNGQIGIIEKMCHVLTDVEKKGPWSEFINDVLRLTEKFRDERNKHNLIGKDDENMEEESMIEPFIKDEEIERKRTTEDRLIEKITLFVILRPIFGWERSGFEQCREIVRKMLHDGGLSLMEGFCVGIRVTESMGSLWFELANEILGLIGEFKRSENQAKKDKN